MVGAPMLRPPSPSAWLRSFQRHQPAAWLAEEYAGQSVPADADIERGGHSSTATARAGATLWSTGSRKGPLLAIRRYGIEQTSNAVRTTIKPLAVETTHADSTKFECRGVRPRFRFSEEDDFAFSDCFRAAGSLATPQFLSSLSLFVVRDVPLIVRVILAHAASCTLGGWLSRADFHYFPRLRSRIVFQVAAR
jgi:hypothetical protein